MTQKYDVQEMNDDIENQTKLIVHEIRKAKKKELETLNLDKELQEEMSNRIMNRISEICGQKIDQSSTIPKEAFYQAIDEVLGDPDNLIKPSHKYRKYSLVKHREHKQGVVPSSGNTMLDNLIIKSNIRSDEINREFTSENTKKAFNGDIAYWHLWLCAVGFDFRSPISEDLVKLFIIQHIEEMDPYIDNLLVEKGFKTKKGTHSISTVKRRIINLSVCLDLDEHPNPCKSQEVKSLLSRLSKKHKGTTRKKAITRDILDELLRTCGDSVIDIRDKAVLLFGWASGGRRRSEIANAKIENLTQTEEGDFVYEMKESKTDQEGKGHTVPIKGRAAKALKDWLKLVKSTSGPIFRSITKGGIVRENPLSGIDINRIVKKRAKMAEHDTENYGAHSLRSGFVTEGGRKGKHLKDIMAMTAHRNVATAMKYYETGETLLNPAAHLAD